MNTSPKQDRGEQPEQPGNTVDVMDLLPFDLDAPTNGFTKEEMQQLRARYTTAKKHFEDGEPFMTASGLANFLDVEVEWIVGAFEKNRDFFVPLVDFFENRVTHDPEEMAFPVSGQIKLFTILRTRIARLVLDEYLGDFAALKQWARSRPRF